jgi:hypothetical protein
VITAGAYGILAGTLVGLVAWPLSGSERAIFLGSSLGLYLGIGVGFYHIHNRDEPGNPLASSSMGGEGRLGPGAVRTPYTPKPMRPWVNFAVARF